MFLGRGVCGLIRNVQMFMRIFFKLIIANWINSIHLVASVVVHNVWILQGVLQNSLRFSVSHFSAYVALRIFILDIFQ